MLYVFELVLSLVAVAWAKPAVDSTHVIRQLSIRLDESTRVDSVDSPVSRDTF